MSFYITERLLFLPLFPPIRCLKKTSITYRGSVTSSVKHGEQYVLERSKRGRRVLASIVKDLLDFTLISLEDVRPSVHPSDVRSDLRSFLLRAQASPVLYCIGTPATPMPSPLFFAIILGDDAVGWLLLVALLLSLSSSSLHYSLPWEPPPHVKSSRSRSSS
jgi:hypothetical protein